MTGALLLTVTCFLEGCYKGSNRELQKVSRNLHKSCTAADKDSKQYICHLTRAKSPKDMPGQIWVVQWFVVIFWGINHFDPKPVALQSCPITENQQDRCSPAVFSSLDLGPSWKDRFPEGMRSAKTRIHTSGSKKIKIAQ